MGTALRAFAHPTTGRGIQGDAEGLFEAYVIALQAAARIWSRPHSPVSPAWLVTKST
jgi:hypothetical protein